MTGPSPSAERLQRLLAMVPWVAGQDGPTLSEICSRFDITPAQLAADLEVIWLVGLPPYTPDALVDGVQEGGAHQRTTVQDRCGSLAKDGRLGCGERIMTEG